MLFVSSWVLSFYNAVFVYYNNMHQRPLKRGARKKDQSLFPPLCRLIVRGEGGGADRISRVIRGFAPYLQRTQLTWCILFAEFTPQP